MKIKYYKDELTDSFMRVSHYDPDTKELPRLYKFNDFVEFHDLWVPFVVFYDSVTTKKR